MFFSFFKKISLFSKEKNLQKILQKIVNNINALENKFKIFTDEELKSYFQDLKLKVKNGSTLEQALEEVFALVREASKRMLNMRHFDVQLMAGIVMHWGNIAELKTGEGKTLVAPLAACLNAINGKVHIISMNDYLVKRDSQWMRPIYNLLGLEVGCIHHEIDEFQKKIEYSKDIIYVTNNEKAFDYLRDNMKFSREEMVSVDQFEYCIVDEADSILIDEGRTPLIISGQSDVNSPILYKQVQKIIKHLQINEDYEIDEKQKSVYLTEKGQINAEKFLLAGNVMQKNTLLYDIENSNILNILIQSLKAENCFHNGVNYMIIDNSIAIVDEFTGRADTSRRYAEGLHQALEAKEGMNIKPENKTLASISYQNFFRLYKKISGMTGTAKTEEKELKDIYNLNVIQIPTHQPIQRTDHNDLIYMTQEQKINAIIEKIKEIHKKKQPILIGTISIEKSEILSRKLKANNITHNVLNAKHHEKEATIIAEAGRLGAITIATNMAGRGTDIKLGGNLDSKIENISSREEKDKITQEHEKERELVIKAGGLYVIGTERHENRRIDNQLIGRSGRQGDPGESQFYLSLDDDLLRIFGGDKMAMIMSRFGKSNVNEPMKHTLLDNAVKNSQKRVESFHAQMRKNILKYDDVQNKQRMIVCEQRMNFIDSNDILEIVRSMIQDLNKEIFEQNNKNADLKKFVIHEIYNIKAEEQISLETLNTKTINELNNKIKNLDFHQISNIFREILLSILDQEWQLHLNSIEEIKESIQLRSYANKDPFIEFQNETYSMFGNLLSNIVRRSLEIIFRIKIKQNFDSSDFALNKMKNT